MSVRSVKGYMTADAGVVDDGTSRRCLSGYLLSHSSCCLIQDDAGVLATVQSVGGVVDGSRGSWAWLLLLPSLILKPPLILSVKETPPVSPSTCIRCSPTCSTATSICPLFFLFVVDLSLFVCLSFDSCKKEETMENGPEFCW